MAYGTPEKICPGLKSNGPNGYKRFLKRAATKRIRKQKITEDSPSKIKTEHHGWSD